MENELSCKICYEKYNRTDRKPMITGWFVIIIFLILFYFIFVNIVMCCHTTCLSCLNQLKKQANYKCSHCREIILSEKPNFALIDLIQASYPYLMNRCLPR